MGSISEENGLELKAAMFERKKNHLVSRDKKKVSFTLFPLSVCLPFFFLLLLLVVVVVVLGFLKCIIKGIGGRRSAGRSTGLLAAANLGASRAEGGGTSTDGHLWQQAIITAAEM